MRWSGPNSRPALTLSRLLKRRFGATAPRVSVRTHIPWYWRAAPALALVLACLVGAALYFGSGLRRGVGTDETSETVRLRERIDALEAELAQFRSNAQSAGSTLQIERTTREQIERQIKQLEAENARLKQDVSMFESLAEIEGAGAGATITGLSVEAQETPGQYRYRMLIAVRGANKAEREREFYGQLQLVVRLRQQGKAAIMNLPLPGDPKKDQFRLKFKHFQRVDGGFEVPAGSEVTSVEVRLLEEGATKVAKVINLG